MNLNYVSVDYNYIKDNVGMACEYYRRKRAKVRSDFLQDKMKEFNQEKDNLFDRIKYVFFPNSRKEYLWEYQVEERLNEGDDYLFAWRSARTAYKDILDELDELFGAFVMINEDEKHKYVFYINSKIFEAIQRARNNFKLKGE